VRSRHPGVRIHLMATWSRAGLPGQPRPGRNANRAMARDIRIGNDRAAAGAGVESVIPVGEA
jgi:hypothetical protein